MFSTRLDRRLLFLPLGLLWGLVAGCFQAYQLILVVDDRNIYYRGVEFNEIILPMIMVMVGACPIATLLGSAKMKPELSSIRWTLNWVITAFASSAGGVAIFWMMLIVWRISWTAAQQAPIWSNSISIVESLALVLLTFLLFPTGFGILIGIECAAVALVLAPVSLLGRRLILRRVSAAEPTSGASQAHP